MCAYRVQGKPLEGSEWEPISYVWNATRTTPYVTPRDIEGHPIVGEVLTTP